MPITYLEIHAEKKDDGNINIYCDEGIDITFPKGTATCWSDGDVQWDEFAEDLKETLLERIELPDKYIKNTHLEIDAWENDDGTICVYCHEGIDITYPKGKDTCWSDGDMEWDEFIEYFKKTLLERSGE